jgi:soluble P-type ATPase
MPLRIEIPGRRLLELDGIVFDLNGTLTVDGVLAAETRLMLARLGEHLKVFVLTADTFGAAAVALEGLPLELVRLRTAVGFREKYAFIKALGADRHAAVGNGYNDHLMLTHAALAVAVMGPEGCHPMALQAADLLVPSAPAAVELFLEPRRIIAGMRR